MRRRTGRWGGRNEGSGFCDARFPLLKERLRRRVAINQFDSLEAILAWRDSGQFKEARKIGDKYAKFRSFAIQGLPQ